MTPDVAGRPEVPARVWTPEEIQALADIHLAAHDRLGTWYRLRDAEYQAIAEAACTRLRAEVEASAKAIEAAIARLDKAEKDMRDENLWGYGLKSVHVMPVQAIIEETRALLAARKGEG